jgi:hypothetical protein
VRHKPSSDHVDPVVIGSSGFGGVFAQDGATLRKLTGRKLSAYGFSRDDAHAYGVFRNSSGNGPDWRLYMVNVSSGAETPLTPLELPASTDDMYAFSLHPDGSRFLTSIARWPFDIWMLEGFDAPRSKTWFERFTHR